MKHEALPEGSYLATQYVDRRRHVETRRVYYEDGRVAAFDGNGWWSVCQFSPGQVRQAQDAIRASGLRTAADLRPEEGLHDTAALAYAWRLDGQQGSLTNWAYPARRHPAQEMLGASLDDLEVAAGYDPFGDSDESDESNSSDEGEM